jgi:hypothetical protein
MRRFKSLILSLSLIFFTFIAIPSAHAALGVSSLTSSPISSTGGGSGYTSTCTSPRVLSSLSSYTYPFDGSTALSYLTGNCATLAADGLTIATAGAQSIGGYGSLTTAGTLAQLDCSTNGGNSVITGARVYKTPNGYTAGVQPQCGTLPNGASRALLGSTLGITTATYEDIACNAGSIAVGLNVRSGGILDTFGIQCAALTGSGQPIVVSSLGTSSKAYPYSQTLSMTVSGTLGSGAVTYAIAAGGTATGCALSNSSSSATISATSSGTCLVAATIASDASYQSSTSPGAAFTFNRGTQSALSISTTTGSYGSALALGTSGGTGGGAVTYSTATGSMTCTLSGSNLTAGAVGTCLVTATKGPDANYDTATSTQATITFSQSLSTALLTIDVGDLVYRQSKNLTVVTNTAGKVSLKVNSVFIPGCKNLRTTVGNSYTITCAYKPSLHGAVKITVTFAPTDAGFLPTSSITGQYWVSSRSAKR